MRVRLQAECKHHHNFFFFFTISLLRWPSSPLIYDPLSTKGLKGEGKNKRERRTRSKCKWGEPGEEREMYLFPREHATPHGSLQINEHSLHTHRIPGDLTRTRDACTCFFSHLYPQHLKILISKGFDRKSGFRASLFPSVF